MGSNMSKRAKPFPGSGYGQAKINLVIGHIQTAIDYAADFHTIYPRVSLHIMHRAGNQLITPVQKRRIIRSLNAKITKVANHTGFTLNKLHN